MRRFTLTLPLAVVLHVTVMAGVTCAQELSPEFPNGVALHLSAQGQVTALRIAGTEVPLKTPGGFFLTDYKHQPQPVNLVPNPGFEDGATGWRLAAGQTLDAETAHSGHASVRLHVPGPETGSSNLGVRVPVQPGHRYRVGIWMRRHECGVCGAYASEFGADGKLSGKVGQVGLPVPRQDDTWEFASRDLEMGPHTTQLLLRADIYHSTGTIWLDDFTIYEIGKPVAQPVTGKVSFSERTQKSEHGAEFRGTAAQCEVQVQLTSSKDCIRVDGKIQDLTKTDRAIGLSFRLPFDAAGWTWYDDNEERRVISDPLAYCNTYPCVSAAGECSIYPWSALTNKNQGLCCALPLSQGPRVFVIDYDNAVKEFEVTFFFGLCQDTARAPGAAKFSFVLYPVDPQWGMRSAAQQYYALFPDSFVKRPVYEGYLNYANLERFDPVRHTLAVSASSTVDASDFGEGYDFIWHLHGCYDFHIFPTDDATRPSDAAVMSFMQKLAAEEKDHPASYCPASDVMKKLVYDSRGHISYIGDTRFWKPHEGYNHTDKSGWGLNFRVDEDPGVSNALAEKSRTAVNQFLAANKPAPFSSCLTADAIEGYMCNRDALDYRRDHFRTTALPLTFGKDNLQPAMPNTIWDFLHEVWWPLTQEKKVIIYGNANGYEQAFTLPYCDIPMVEWDWDTDHPGRFERYIRSMAYHKIWRFWRTCGKGEQDPVSVLHHFDRALACAIYPAVYPLVTNAGDIETYREQFRQYVPAIEALSRAGWEPVPFAHTSSGDVVIERFGSFASGDLHFTLRNYSDQTAATTIRFDADGLDISPEQLNQLVAYDLLRGPWAAESISASAWKVSVPPQGSRAFWVGELEQMTPVALSQADYDFGRLERLFAHDLTAEQKSRIAGERRQLQASTLAGMAPTAAQSVDDLTDSLLGGIKTQAPIDLAKVIYRIKADLAGIAAENGLRCDAPRAVDGFRGAAAIVTMQLTNASAANLTDVRAQVISPWAKAQQQSQCKCASVFQLAGGASELECNLFVPGDVDRSLLPFLIRVTANSGSRPLRLYLPVDVVVKAPIQVTAVWNRVIRGGTSIIHLKLSNALPEPVTGTLAAKPVAGITIQPQPTHFSIAAHANTDVTWQVHAAESVQLGDLLIPYSISGATSAIASQGTVRLLICTPVPRTTIHHLQGTVKLDGELIEPIWQAAPTIPAFGRLADGKPVTQTTSAWIAYGDDGLYVAMNCSETNMAGVKAELSERGSPLYRDDDVEMFILPPGQSSPLQFAVNPLGTQNDNSGNKAPWRAAAKRHDKGWTVEMFIPYSVLGLNGPPAAGTVLPVQLGRQEKPHNETSSWSTCTAFIDATRFGELVFGGR